MFFQILIAIALAIIAGYLYAINKFMHFKRQGIPYLKPKIFFGNLEGSIRNRQNIVYDIDALYKWVRVGPIGFDKKHRNQRKPLLWRKSKNLFSELSKTKCHSVVIIRDFVLTSLRSILSSYVQCSSVTLASSATTTSGWELTTRKHDKIKLIVSKCHNVITKCDDTNNK